MQTTTQAPKTQNIIKTFAIDAGNRFIKWIDRNGNPNSLPSYSLQLEDWMDTPRPTKRSVTLEIDGDRYVVGQLAKELGGEPTFQGDKSALSKLLVLSAITPIGDSTLPLMIENLRIALPDSRYKKDLENLRKLEQVRTVVRNGVNFTYGIRKIEAIDEGIGAYRFARQAKLFQYVNRPNAILDIGGGTSLAKVFSPGGVLMRASDLILPGTFDLAKQVATALLPKINYSPDLGMIMDGIAEGNYLLGTTGISFATEFEKARQKWVEGLKSQLRTHWKQEFQTIGEVLIVGGSAPLLKEFTENPRFKIAPNHAFISVKGMLLDEDSPL